MVGNDPLSDLALVKVDTENLTAAHWGNSDALEVGDEVLAVGNPYGLARSVTAGIISAKSRHVDIEQRERSFLQTDAAVNPGNSGGPLVNLSGEVVGINTAIVGHSYQGISFAIPSQLAERVYERLKSSGSIARGYIGVALQDLNPQLAEQLHAKNTYGAVVTGVVKGSPAAEAGIEMGDVIVAVADQKINDSEDLRTAVARAKIGDSLKVAFFRDGREGSASHRGPTADPAAIAFWSPCRRQQLPRVRRAGPGGGPKCPRPSWSALRPDLLWQPKKRPPAPPPWRRAPPPPPRAAVIRCNRSVTLSNAMMYRRQGSSRSRMPSAGGQRRRRLGIRRRAFN